MGLTAGGFFTGPDCCSSGLVTMAENSASSLCGEPAKSSTGGYQYCMI
jgi:hypothetical protein